MITWIYRIIALFIFVLIVVNLFTKEKIKDQANAAIILIPLMLRFLLIE